MKLLVMIIVLLTLVVIWLALRPPREIKIPMLINHPNTPCYGGCDLDAKVSDTNYIPTQNTNSVFPPQPGTTFQADGVILTTTGQCDNPDAGKIWTKCRFIASHNSRICGAPVAAGATTELLVANVSFESV